MQFNIPAEHKNASGVYIIRNSVNAKVYVGSAQNLRHRYTVHLRQLKNLNHHSVLLQNFANKYGFDSLSFELLELAKDSASLLPLEQKWLDSTLCYKSNAGFNICPTAGSPRGRKHSPETIEKMRAARSGRVIKPETGRKISEALRGQKRSPDQLAKMRLNRKPVSQEAKQAQSKALKGRIFTPAHRLAISIAAKNRTTESRKHSPETIEKMRAARSGRVMSPEAKQKIRIAATGRVQSEESRRKNSEANKGKKRSPETRQKISEANRGRQLTNEAKQKISAAQKRVVPESRKHSPETRQKISEANRGKKLTDETKQKIGATRKRRWAITLGPVAQQLGLF